MWLFAFGVQSFPVNTLLDSEIKLVSFPSSKGDTDTSYDTDIKITPRNYQGSVAFSGLLNVECTELAKMLRSVFHRMLQKHWNELLTNPIKRPRAICRHLCCYVTTGYLKMMPKEIKAEQRKRETSLPLIAIPGYPRLCEITQANVFS